MVKISRLLTVILLLISVRVPAQTEAVYETYLQASDSLLSSGEYEKALLLLTETYKTLRTSEKVSHKLHTGYLENIAHCYFRLGNYTAAIEWFQTLLEQERQKGNLESIASTLNNIGLSYKMRGNYDKAIDYYEEAIRIDEELGKGGEIAKTLNNIGMVYREWGKYDKAIAYLERSLGIKNNLHDKAGVSKSLNNIGLIYSEWQNYEQAIVNFRESLKIEEEIGDFDEQARRLNNLGTVYYFMGKHDSANIYHGKALIIYLKSNNRDMIALSYNNIGKVHVAQKKFPEAIKLFNSSLEIYNETGRQREKATVLANLSDIYRSMGNINYALQLLDSSTVISQELNQRKQLQQNYLYYSEIYSDQQNYKKALEYYQKYSQVKDSIFSDEILRQLSDFQVRYETEKKENEIQILRQSQKIQELALKKQTIFRNSMFAVSALLLALAIIIYASLQRKKRDNQLIAEAKKKSDQLLLNILPAGVANELKEKGRAEPQLFHDTSVCFIDIVDFTKKAATLDPGTLLKELNEIYTAFDRIIENCTCERIKTIGDCYMAVSGLPEPQPEHAKHMIRSCIEMIRFLRKRNATSGLKWEVRIGIHSGDVIAGVVGVKKFIYDVFGETINLASRLENKSEPMKINISEATYNLIKDEFEAEPRGEIEVKNMSPVTMYFVRA